MYPPYPKDDYKNVVKYYDSSFNLVKKKRYIINKYTSCCNIINNSTEINKYGQSLQVFCNLSEEYYEKVIGTAHEPGNRFSLLDSPRSDLLHPENIPNRLYLKLIDYYLISGELFQSFPNDSLLNLIANFQITKPNVKKLIITCQLPEICSLIEDLKEYSQYSNANERNIDILNFDEFVHLLKLSGKNPDINISRNIKVMQEKFLLICESKQC